MEGFFFFFISALAQDAKKQQGPTAASFRLMLFKDGRCVEGALSFELLCAALASCCKG